MKTYKLLKYIGIIFILGSIILFPLFKNSEIRFGCIMFTLLGMYSLVNSSINKDKFYPNE